jgi:hypothetical protein
MRHALSWVFMDANKNGSPFELPNYFPVTEERSLETPDAIEAVHPLEAMPSVLNIGTAPGHPAAHTFFFLSSWNLSSENPPFLEVRGVPD